MENATKALLIGAGILIAIIILSSLLILYNQVSGFYQNSSNMTEEQQRVEFNKTFENYEDKEIRGNELLSIMNMIDDYNTTEPEKGYDNMEFVVDFISADNFKQFNYEGVNSKTYLLSEGGKRIVSKGISYFVNSKYEEAFSLII